MDEAPSNAAIMAAVIDVKEAMIVGFSQTSDGFAKVWSEFDLVRDEMRRGFHATNNRIDETNVRIDEMNVRIEALEPHRRRDRS
jgi:hypothetical protein